MNKVRRSSIKKKLLCIVMILVAFAIAVVAIKYLPINWGKWSQLAFFGIVLVVGTILELLVGKFVRD